ncbi:HD domain-containing protein [Halenospora varia]|nr:HD domain-containing protein [Halenospora varia]
MTTRQELITKVTEYVRKYMANYDASHDFEHIKRVVGTASTIYNEIQASGESKPKLDPTIITLGALLHDIGDRKYIKEGEEEKAKTMVQEKLLEFGASEELATKVQTVCNGVSYSSEKENRPPAMKALIDQYPELAVVQDADRLDAIGAVGVGRAFTYGGAKTDRSMEDTIKIFDQKLFEIEGKMKTGPGRRMARARTEILRSFKKEWRLEVASADVGSKLLAISTFEED